MVVNSNYARSKSGEGRCYQPLLWASEKSRIGLNATTEVLNATTWIQQELSTRQCFEAMLELEVTLRVPSLPRAVVLNLSWDGI